MKKRIFIRDSTNYYQMFSFTQVNDGCIYSRWPGFSDTVWLGAEKDNSNWRESIVGSSGVEGKLSIHRSGRQHIGGNNEAGYKMIRWGNHLVNVGEAKIGVRHLFTICPTQPESLENYQNRDSHILLDHIGQIKPFAIVFFAIPGVKKLTISMGAGFHVDDVALPPESGFGYFPLRQHNVAFFYYRTKNMESWPAQTHVAYHDGFSVPLFIPKGGDPKTKERRMLVDFRSPKYSHVIGDEQDELSILF